MTHRPFWQTGTSQSVCAPHAAPSFLGAAQQPFTLSQVPTAHGPSSAEQSIEAPATHAPALHAPWKQASALWHGAPSFAGESLHALVASSQRPRWQVSLEGQYVGVPPTHAPAWQESFSVQ